MNRTIKTTVLAFAFVVGIVNLGWSQQIPRKNKFAQLKQELPTPNVYRTASGAPGPKYYQQRADYKMNIVVDEQNKTLKGEERITYHNNSPQKLTYIWMQLDQNVRKQHSLSSQGAQHKVSEQSSFRSLSRLENDFDGGFKLDYIQDASGKALPYTVNHTMVRIELPTPLKPNEKFVFDVKWWYNINNRAKDHGRSGYEFFEEEDNTLFTIAQFYPRMCVYNETEGWQNYQFLGTGEFTLDFGNYEVDITVPSDHIVGATGELENASKVLTAKQQKRMALAKQSDEPVLIVNQQEAEETEKSKASGTKTWSYKASNVRDFAFASSRKFIWDAMGVELQGKTVMAMSLYPKEGNPLWGKYSTKVVAHTLRTYSKYTIDYPYPVAYSVHTNRIGMEYPMICFNGGRPEKDGTYSESTKWGMIHVIIHEVGHNFFPMIINSDERQWGWMDEGLNTFFDGVTAREFDGDLPTWSGKPENISHFMASPKEELSPIMVNSDANYNYGPNAYHKPATALAILRETVMGRDLFDYAMKEYARRWAFKHPTPADFFRTMEDASGVDLDWYWRGWFYGTDHVDIALSSVQPYQIGSIDPHKVAEYYRNKENAKPQDISLLNDESSIVTAIANDPELKDFYSFYDQYEVTEEMEKAYEEKMNALTPEQKAMLEGGAYYYQLTFENKGGLVSPLILEFAMEDGSKVAKSVPAEIWQASNKNTVTKVYKFDQPVLQIQLDPRRQLADTDYSNNYWPSNPEIIRIMPGARLNESRNPMRDAMKREMAHDHDHDHDHNHPHTHPHE